MARGVLAVQEVVRTGLNPTFGAADETDGHVFANINQNVMLVVKNANTASLDVTITTPGTVDAHAIPDLVVAVPAGEERWIGPFPKAVYETTDAGQDPDLERAILVDISEEDACTLAAVKIGGASY